MNVEILGVDPRNKGAALMLEAIRQEMVAKYDSANLCVSLSFPVTDRVDMRLWALLPRDRLHKKVISSVIEKLIPSKYLRKVGIIKSRDIDVVLDSSGFAYGDFWGVEKLRKRLYNNLSRWKRTGKKVILLPQAWGPFQEPGFKRVLKEVISSSDLAFYRDSTSKEHISSCVGLAYSNLRYSPDFTCSLTTVERSDYVLEGASYIIPNEKVVASSEAQDKFAYTEFLVSVAIELRSAGHNVFILNHEGVKDENLAKDIQDSLNKKGVEIEIVTPRSALETKKYLASARAVVSSRFHGLVSALSSGVPVLACGWSHKYYELLKDYNCERFVVDFKQLSKASEQLRDFVDVCDRSDFKESIEAHADRQRELTVEMWAQVHACISGPDSDFIKGSK
ncbi:MAG: hypothetical protein CL561_02455 [Alphaproteobacteria bacterium]|nr:hypothetical protein [Alphaproteobacteria bacterium]|tara:strand:- start:398 stop:1576 length:1179 start_codon:yes stop_codon:yes gene_type:complete